MFFKSPRTVTSVCAPVAILIQKRQRMRWFTSAVKWSVLTHKKIASGSQVISKCMQKRSESNRPHLAVTQPLARWFVHTLKDKVKHPIVSRKKNFSEKQKWNCFFHFISHCNLSSCLPYIHITSIWSQIHSSVWPSCCFEIDLHFYRLQFHDQLFQQDSSVVWG